MTHKKHRQHKGVYLNHRRGLRVGGIVIPYWPSYWNGVGSGDVHQGQPTNEGANDGNDTGSDSSGGSDGGSGANA